MTTIANAPLAMWKVLPEHPGAGPQPRDVLRLGQVQMRFGDISGYRVEAHTERDWRGLVLSGTAFMITAAFFMMFVIDFGWRTRFWLAVAFFISLGLSSVIEASQITSVRYQRLLVWDKSGQTHTFTCADVDHMRVLLAVLQQRVGPPQHA